MINLIPKLKIQIIKYNLKIKKIHLIKVNPKGFLIYKLIKLKFQLIKLKFQELLNLQKQIQHQFLH